MRIAPIYTPTMSPRVPSQNYRRERETNSQSVSFQASPLDVGYRFDNLQNIYLQFINRTVICKTFDNLLKELNGNPLTKKFANYQEAMKIYESSGLRGLLAVLGQPNSELLSKIKAGNKKQLGSMKNHVLAQTHNFDETVFVRDDGQYGFFNSIFDRNTKRNVSIGVQCKDDTVVLFGLDKSDDFLMTKYGFGIEESKVSYYANKDKVKSVILPKGDLYLPPGL